MQIHPQTRLVASKHARHRRQAHARWPARSRRVNRSGADERIAAGASSVSGSSRYRRRRAQCPETGARRLRRHETAAGSRRGGAGAGLPGLKARGRGFLALDIRQSRAPRSRAHRPSRGLGTPGARAWRCRRLPLRLQRCRREAGFRSSWTETGAAQETTNTRRKRTVREGRVQMSGKLLRRGLLAVALPPLPASPSSPSNKWLRRWFPARPRQYSRFGQQRILAPARPRWSPRRVVTPRLCRRFRIARPALALWDLLKWETPWVGAPLAPGIRHSRVLRSRSASSPRSRVRERED